VTERVNHQGRIVTPLCSGPRVLNLDFSLPDGFTAKTGSLATVFARDDDFVRVTSSVRKQDGDRTAGTPLDRSQPAYTDVSQGRNHLGYAIIFGRQYLTHCEPIRGNGGQIIGILFVGLNITDPPGMVLSASMAWRISTIDGAFQLIFLGLTDPLNSGLALGTGLLMTALLWVTPFALVNRYAAAPLKAGRAASQRMAAGDLTRQVHA
jgi:methyl-accepting chemotaxis protein